ncbi:FHA domain-containing protein [Adlercreutzia sp. ZJ138]|uniref:FHA domain-containing protein n=1 Tax=Adlercreutzia sp. ZJ138 TaxID=2709405 RepID=UPI0013EDD8EF|nr:FHA domain-containing protein [Adlercreutzia sp. ZJ138]
MNVLCPVCNNDFDAALNGACPFCGFKLAESTQRFEPIVLTDVTNTRMAPVRSSASLRVVRGPQTGIEFRLEGDSIRLGRNPHCEIFLNDMTVSRDHATIERSNSGSYAIVDNHSYNGLWVNNENVDAAELKSGDFIQIGSFCLVYQED